MWCNLVNILRISLRVLANYIFDRHLTQGPFGVVSPFRRCITIKHVVDNDFLTDCQHGFVKGCSCTTQLLEVVDKLCGLLDNGDTVDMVYLDFLCKGL